MAKIFFWIGMLAMVLVFGMAVVGCDDDPTNSNGENGGQNLPSASGVNAVSGKTYIESRNKTDFSITAEGASNGTYAVSTVDNGTYASGVKFTYNTQIQTGTYSWNEEAKTVTLKPEMIASSSYYGQGESSDSITIDNAYGPLKDRAGYRSELQAMIDAFIEENGQNAFNQVLSSMGFSSASAYINYEVNEAFANQTYGYSFSLDGAALFLEKALPANKGTNEFTGQTYYRLTWAGIKDETQTYVFTSTGYTFTSQSETITGSYAYDSTKKQVWLRPETINGKNRVEYYTEQTANTEHHYPNDSAHRAVKTDTKFQFWPEDYNITNKTIGWEN